MKRFSNVFLLALSCVLVFSGTAAFGQEIRSEQYFQPVQIRLPKGDLAEASASFAVGTTFVDPIGPEGVVGLLVGPTYRFRVNSIPYNEGRELFPTIRLLGRLNPPSGKELEFPIIVELTQEDLELALAGKFVTRVVYLESPTTALPARLDENRLSHDVAPGADPLAVAETLGRPIAVIRIGSRIPDTTVFFGSPAFVNYGLRITNL
ncbi:MAG: hypothetical protein FWC43_00605 [Planctomycetaceae bacterium]|nr:hypothetical protein [Planctomycetaceae bacterium]